MNPKKLWSEQDKLALVNRLIAERDRLRRENARFRNKVKALQRHLQELA